LIGPRNQLIDLGLHYCASKLAIRKSWLIEEERKRQLQQSLTKVITQDEVAFREQDPMHQRLSRLAHDEEQNTTKLVLART
jgi:hypothetical protein